MPGAGPEKATSGPELCLKPEELGGRWLWGLGAWVRLFRPDLLTVLGLQSTGLGAA